MRSNEPANLLERAAVLWREARDEGILTAYRAAQHLDGKHEGAKANDLCLYCQEDCRDEA